MAVIPILQYPNPRLGQKATLVEDVKASRIQTIIKDMFETLYAADNCAALAASQLDINQPPHITVIDFSEKKDQPLCLVNAVISNPCGETNTPEGCMSVPFGTYEKVVRAETIHVSALDQHGKTLDFDADDFMAKCIQHELDHLNGTLFIDHLSKLKRKRVDTRISKSYKRQKKIADNKTSNPET
jgi:peptide deformylase